MFLPWIAGLFGGALALWRLDKIIERLEKPVVGGLSFLKIAAIVGVIYALAYAQRRNSRSGIRGRA